MVESHVAHGTRCILLTDFPSPANLLAGFPRHRSWNAHQTDGSSDRQEYKDKLGKLYLRLSFCKLLKTVRIIGGNLRIDLVRIYSDDVVATMLRQY